MAVEWCEMGFYGVDPVQRRANQTTRPFVWSYYKDEPTVIAQNLEETAVAAIAQRLMSWGLGRGVTVPIHLPGNRFATMTGFLESPNLSEEDVARFSYLVACAQDAMTPHLRPFNVIGPIRPLTDRETECVRLTGEGLSSKQIAVALQRTERTVVMHLQSAARKLGARNRVHTVVKAGEYGLLH
jgi:LuxR family transcriptional regulator